MSLNLYKRGEVYHVRGTVAGRRIRKSTGHRQRKAAEEYAAQLEAAAWKRDYYGPEAVATFGMAFVAYSELGRSLRFTAPIVNTWHHRKLASIKPTDVQQLAIDLYPYASPATRNRQVLTPVQSIINVGHDKGWCPPIRVKKFKVDQVQKRAVTMGWIDEFMAACKSPYLSAIALFMVTTGARIGQAVELTRDNLDIPARSVLIPAAKNHPARVATLTTDMMLMLANLPAKKGTVFGYAHRSSVYGPWKTACRHAGIEYVPPHQAGRHTFATEMITRHGVDVATTAKAGGWKSARLLLDTYVHTEDTASAINGVFDTSLTQRRIRKRTKS